VKRLRSAIYARYQEVHEQHLAGLGRAEWMSTVVGFNIVPHLHGDVLEIGCGAGDALKAIAKRGFPIEGTDLCPANVEQLSRQGYNVTGDDLLQGDRWRVAEFDTIVMMGVIEHFEKDELLEVVDRLYAMLRPGGCVVLTTQNMDAFSGAHQLYMDLTHGVGFTRESLCELGRLVFKEADCYPWQDVPGTGWRWRLLNALRPIHRRLFRIHLQLIGGWLVDTWYDVDALVGVWRK
jgi:SAM-dependent methyltransferase